MRVVITGGAGFIGANLARHLRGRVEELVIVDDFSTGNPDNLAGLEIEVHEGSILDRPTLDAAFAGASAVVHLAARPSVPRSVADPIASHHANATGTAEVLEAVRRAAGGGNGTATAHLVVASSSSVYGSNPTIPKAEHLMPQPVSPYAASKLATESYALAWAETYGLDVLAFRFFNVFGPLQPANHAYAAVVPAFVDAALSGRPLPVHGDGRQTRDFTFVDSVSHVIADALVRRVTSPTPVNLAFGSSVSLLELIAELETVLGESVAVDHQPTRAGDVRDSQADTSRLQALFPAAAPVPLRDGLAATVAWFRSRG